MLCETPRAKIGADDRPVAATTRLGVRTTIDTYVRDLLIPSAGQSRMAAAVELPAPLPHAEELANAATHALGFVLSLLGTIVLVRITVAEGTALQMAGVGIYGATLMALYAASALSHSFEQPRLRHFFRTVDQVCIFLLIAGTYTPIALSFSRGDRWWSVFLTVWGLALAGCFVKIFFAKLQNVAVSAYVLVGWVPAAMAIGPIVETLPSGPLAWIVVGGVFYTLGTVFLMRDEQVPFFHAVWHLFVIVGSACHWVAIFGLVTA